MNADKFGSESYDQLWPKCQALKASREELLAVLRIALYDLAILNKKDPLYRPRCLSKAQRAIAKAEGK